MTHECCRPRPALAANEMSAAAKGLRPLAESSPLGATVVPGGVNFSVFSRNASGVELLFFDREDDAQPARVIAIDPAANRTYHYWHVFVPGVQPGQLYAISGTRDRPTPRTACGLIRQGSPRSIWPRRSCAEELQPRSGTPRRRQRRHGDEERGGGSARVRLGRRHIAAPAVLSDHHLRDARERVHAPSEFRSVGKNTWHVCRFDSRRFRISSNSGITAVELLPVFQFDSQDAPLGLVNYWGYAPVSFFAPHQGYSSRQRSTRPGERVSRHGQGAAPGAASRSFSTLSSITPPKATTAGRR